MNERKKKTFVGQHDCFSVNREEKTCHPYIMFLYAYVFFAENTLKDMIQTLLWDGIYLKFPPLRSQIHYRHDFLYDTHDH